MKQIDASYLYKLGQTIQPLKGINQVDTYGAIWIPCFVAKTELESFISTGVYSDTIQILKEPTAKLINILDELIKETTELKKGDKKIEIYQVSSLTTKIQEFEIIFNAEFKQGNLFLATNKGAYDLGRLIFHGETLFPTDLEKLVPNSIKDIKDGARCLAFELYSASAFHFHRANECVLLEYMAKLKVQKPKYRSMGSYINALKTVPNIPQELIACLQNLKDLHRNPIMHPDRSIDSFDDANALLNTIQTCITEMLKIIRLM